MDENTHKFNEELKRLIQLGKNLNISLLIEFNQLNASDKKKYKEKDYPSFSNEYENWYSEAQQVVKQIIPDRLVDFNHLYKDERRRDKNVDYLSYTISDKLIGLHIKRGTTILTDGSAAIAKFQQQVRILKSCEKRFESTLFDIKQIVRADIFDNEIDSAEELLKYGFLRASGAIAGVVLEKHLKEVCITHIITVVKKNPSIGDYNDLLRSNNVIDIPAWRFIQHLGDIRNICDHSKEREPTKDELNDLIQGVRKITKTVY